MKLLLKMFSALILVFIVSACHTITPEQCTTVGGRWLTAYDECENVSEAWCKANKGKYKACESVCRHAPSPGPCVMQCVEVCKF